MVADSGKSAALADEYVDVDSARIWTTRSGSGPPLLLCHGGPGLWDYLQPVAALIDDLVSVYRYDQRGCGRSSPDGPYSVARSVEDIESLRRRFGFERWLVGGHSWGASLALAYAWEHPERVDGIVYMSGVGLAMSWKQAYREEEERRLTPVQRDRLAALRDKERDAAEERESLVLAWSRDFADRSTAMDYAARFQADGFAVNYECNSRINRELGAWVESDLVEKCRILDVPVLILHGALDPRPVWAADSLVESLPPRERSIIEGAGHLPWVEKPDEVKAALREFLRQLPVRE